MPTPTLEDRVTILETRFDTTLPTLATKADIAEVKTDMAEIRTDMVRLEGKMDAMNERLDGKIDAMGNRLLIRFAIIAVGVATLAVAAASLL